jgi:hypothetical protein
VWFLGYGADKKRQLAKFAAYLNHKKSYATRSISELRGTHMKKLIFAGMTAAAFAGQPAIASAQTAADPAAAETPTLQTIRNENAQLKAEIAALRDRLRLQKEASALRAKLAAGTDVEPPVKPASGSGYVQAPVAGSPKLSPTAANAYAADIAPVYKAMPVTVTEGGVYVWTDGMYDRVHLPTYGLGLRGQGPAAPFPDLGAVQNFDPRLNAGGVRGAIGYAVPGSGFRLEFGGSYIAGSGSLSQNAVTNNALVGISLNANVAFGLACPCAVTGTQNTNYDAWQVNGKAAYDVKYGSFTVTPSAAVFGGNSHADEALTQAVAQIAGGATGAYGASTSLRWTDVGARFGLDTKFAVTDMLTVGVGGWVGAAGRSTSLTGTDTISSSLGGPAPTTPISANDATAVFLANAEAGFAHKLTANVTFRGFVGVNYDDKVPGVPGPSFGSIVARVPLQAGIYYAHETDYYAGLGLLAKFGG